MKRVGETGPPAEYLQCTRRGFLGLGAVAAAAALAGCKTPEFSGSSLASGPELKRDNRPADLLGIVAPDLLQSTSDGAAARALAETITRRRINNGYELAERALWAVQNPGKLPKESATATSWYVPLQPLDSKTVAGATFYGVGRVFATGKGNRARTVPDSQDDLYTWATGYLVASGKLLQVLINVGAGEYTSTIDVGGPQTVTLDFSDGPDGTLACELTDDMETINPELGGWRPIQPYVGVATSPGQLRDRDTWEADLFRLPLQNAPMPVQASTSPNSVAG